MTDEYKQIEEFEDEEKSQITELHPKLQRFIHLYLTGQYTLTKLAELLEVHPNTVYKWIKRDDVKEVITEMQEATHEAVGTQLKALTMKAVNRLHDLVDSPVDGVALNAVNTVLDRTGHKSKNEIKIDKTVTTYEDKLHDVIDTTLSDEELQEVEIVDDEDDGS